MHEQDFNPADLDVRISELLVATADGADEAIDASVGEVLRLIRDRLHMDVVFVSEFVDGQRILRRVEQSAGTQVLRDGQVTPLEETCASGWSTVVSRLMSRRRVGIRRRRRSPALTVSART
jgi:hypothetical protein